MDKYNVRLTSRALRDLNGIYAYISETLQEPETALALVERIENQIFSLEFMPYRCQERKQGIYSRQGYRQLFIDNYTVLFRIDEKKKYIIIITVRYSPSNF